MGGGGANAAARVITQIVYDAYGSVIGRDDPATPATGPPELRVGHKGLFFDRLDAGIYDLVQGRETPRLAPGARLSGYARNRTLHCDFGRWIQPDPNATGLPVQAIVGYHGLAPGSAVQVFNLRTHFGDGPNVYAYVGNGPLGQRDPLGLETLSSLQVNMEVRMNMFTMNGQTYYTMTRAGYEVGMSMAGALPGMSSIGGGAFIGTISGVGGWVAAMLGGTGVVVAPLVAAYLPGEQPLPGERGRGVAGRGWEGDTNWRAAVRDVGRGGDFPTAVHGVPTREEALRLLAQAGGSVQRIEGGHAPGGVSRHTYPHINFTSASGVKGTV